MNIRTYTHADFLLNGLKKLCFRYIVDLDGNKSLYLLPYFKFLHTIPELFAVIFYSNEYIFQESGTYLKAQFACFSKNRWYKIDVSYANIQGDSH